MLPAFVESERIWFHFIFITLARMINCVIISCASAKTALALAFCLRMRDMRQVMVGPFDVACSMLHVAEVCFWPDLQGPELKQRENRLPETVAQYGTALQ